MSAVRFSIDYPGIQSYSFARYSYSHGVAPGVIYVEMPADSGNPASEGDFTFRYGNDSMRLTGCRLAGISERVGSGGRIWEVKLEDRRWRWQFGSITGHYNQRDSTGRVYEQSERTPDELIGYLTEAMGEENYSLNGVPEAARPQIDWTYENPAAALEKLCSDLGCRVMPQTDGGIAVYRVGTGDALTTNTGLEQSGGVSYEPPPRPAKIKVVGAPTKFQVRFELEAVGMDTDGLIKPIDDLGYTPEEGWEATIPPYFYKIDNNEDLEENNPLTLARRSVFSWYRIKLPLDLGNDGEIVSVRQIQLLNEVVERSDETDPVTGEYRSKTSKLFGEFRNDEDFGEEFEEGVFKGNFSLNSKEGIVQLSKPIFKTIETGSETSIGPAKLVLETGCHIRNRETGEFVRYNQVKELGRGNAEIVRVRDELKSTLRYTYPAGLSVRPRGSELNEYLDNIDQEFQHHLDAEAAQYETGAPKQVTYAGMLAINLTGVIQQVSFSLGSSGFVTTASENSDHDPYTPEFKIRRRNQEISLLLNATSQTADATTNSDLTANGGDTK